MEAGDRDAIGKVAADPCKWRIGRKVIRSWNSSPVRTLVSSTLTNEIVRPKVPAVTFQGVDAFLARSRHAFRRILEGDRRVFMVPTKAFRFGGQPFPRRSPGVPRSAVLRSSCGVLVDVPNTEMEKGAFPDGTGTRDGTGSSRMDNMGSNGHAVGRVATTPAPADPARIPFNPSAPRAPSADVSGRSG